MNLFAPIPNFRAYPDWTLDSARAFLFHRKAPPWGGAR